MAGAKTTVETVITVKDDASSGLTAFIKQLDNLGREGQKAGAGIRNLAAPLAFELAPALGTTGGALARIVGSAALATTGFGALAVAVTSLASLVAGQMVDAWKKAREEQEKWAKAFSSGDVGRMTAALNTQADAVRALGKEYNELEARRGTRSPWDLLSPFAPEEQRRRARERLETGLGGLATNQRLMELANPARDEGEFGVKAITDAQEQARINLIRESARSQRGLYDFTLDPLQREIRQRQREAGDLSLGGAREAAGRLRGTIPTLRNFTLAGQLFNAPLPEEFLGFEQISDPTISQEARAALSAGREGRIKRDIERQLEESTQGFERELGGGAEAIGIGPTPKEEAEGARDRVQRLTEARDLERELAELATKRVGLSFEQRDVLAAQLIEATRLRDLEAAGYDERKKDLAEAQASLEQFNLQLTRIQREDPLAGLAEGFREVADEADNAGATMRRFAQTTARSMQQSFSDLFFNVMTGNFKSLEDIGKNFGLSVARSLSDALAQGVSAPIVGLFGQGATAAQSFFGSAAQGGGGLTQPTSGAAVTAQSGGLLAGLGLFGGGGGLLSSSPGAVGQSRQFVDAEFGSPGSAESVGGNIGTGGGGGFNLNAGGVAGLAILAGSIALSASSRGKRTNTQSDFGGALTGASLGLSVGGIYGAAIGAVVGLFASVATSDMKRAEERSQMQRGDPYDVGLLRPHLEADIARVQTAQNFPDLAAAVSGALHEAFGGPRGRGMRGAPGFAMSIGGRQVILPGGSYPATMTLNDLAALLETDADSFEAQIQMGINESTRRQLGQIFEQAVKEQAALIDRLNATSFAYDDVGPGLRRTTILPAGALATADVSGHQLMVDRAGAAAIGLTDAQMDVFIRQFADRNTQTDRIPDFTAELRLQL